ncbi:uncharacterized protein LOC111711202 [Eurytemora carolleeae]|uniref:uncharacterized protein LOC111711202 n=1 Tax=Eurytemora carolleeae TaxID=1294199 RepID=UPI000C761EDB|nr:uncharacterized protein LOC111711202 [Eurytemora carolleeae]|eukprot:XP_023341258.1 uncharacterized protein LOC111711202 [Eurytemora affinis]
MQNYLVSWILISKYLTGVTGIGCFKCSSENGSNPSCEDTFQYFPFNSSEILYQDPCWAGRKDRNGLFPASSCIKLNGVVDENGNRLVIRGCGLDSGSLTSDTEIVRVSHCGSFYLDGRYVRGCVQGCDDMDGCNSALKHAPYFLMYFITNVIFSFTFRQI